LNDAEGNLITTSSNLNMSAAIVAPILVHISNYSIKSNSFPTLFKTAKVVPIYKKGDNTVMSNYRPISILPVISLI